MKLSPCRVLYGLCYSGCTITTSLTGLEIRFPLGFNKPVDFVFGDFTFEQKSKREIVLKRGTQHLEVYMSRKKMLQFLAFLCGNTSQ